MTFLQWYKNPRGLASLSSYAAKIEVFELRFPPCVSYTIEPVSRAGWTKPWERERGASGKKCLSLTLSPRQPGKKGGEGEKGLGSIKGEENNTLWTAGVRGFLQSEGRIVDLFLCGFLCWGLPQCASWWVINYDIKTLTDHFSPPHMSAWSRWNYRAQVQHITSGPNRPDRPTCNFCFISLR